MYYLQRNLQGIKEKDTGSCENYLEKAVKIGRTDGKKPSYLVTYERH
jgi:hypothetical protein